MYKIIVYIVHCLLRFRRKFYESKSDFRFSRPAATDMDKKLSAYLDYENGYFIEAGANDGFFQSNTYYLEKSLKWRGVLVEPIPELYRRCVIERPASSVFNCALVDHDFKESSIEIHYFNAMSYVDGAFSNKEAENSHRQAALSCSRRKKSYSVKVQARTLTQVLEEAEAPSDPDLLVLDVEGFEANVLEGLDFTRFRPKYVLVETNNEDAVSRIMEKCYDRLEKISERDTLFRLKEFSSK